MNMPGFTAEASLRSITRVYRASAGIISKTDQVQMQMLLCFGPPGYETCCECLDEPPYDCYCHPRTLWPELSLEIT
jgi:hypothetical protein